MLIVQKFGGTSLGNPELIRNAAAKTVALLRQGAKVVTVVSAQGDTTDALLQQAQAIRPQAAGRELDALLAAGEQMSAALMALAIREQGGNAVSLTGWQAGIHTDREYGNARILRIDPAPIRRELEAGNAVAVAGFQGIDDSGNITTLGRGGSDTTAVALAAALGADVCRIYTDVDGVYDRDPRKYPDAVRFDRISYARMLALARGGAQVLHDRCVELAMTHRVPLEVRSAFTEGPGTTVS